MDDSCDRLIEHRRPDHRAGPDFGANRHAARRAVLTDEPLHKAEALLRICMLTTCYPLAQSDITCSFVHRLARALVKAGEEVTALAPGAPNAKAHEHMDGVEVYRFTYMWPRSWQQLAYRWGIPENIRNNRMLLGLIPSFFVCFMFRAIHLCRSADIIHAHWLPAGLVALVVGKLLGKPSVVTVHGSDARLLPSFLSRWIVQHVSQVHVVSVEMQEIVRSLGARRSSHSSSR